MDLGDVGADVKVGRDLRLSPPLCRPRRSRSDHGVRLPMQNVSSKKRLMETWQLQRALGNILFPHTPSDKQGTRGHAQRDATDYDRRGSRRTLVLDLPY